MQFLKSVNWIDLLVAAVFFRVIYIGLQTGFVTELFKVLGAILTIFVCFHYYTPLSQFLLHHMNLPAGVMETLTFVALWVLMFMVCKIVRDGLFLIFTIEAQSLVDKWGGAILSISRAFIVASMMLFVSLVSAHPYLEAKTAQCFTGRYVLPVSPGIYRALAEGFVGKLFPTERYNKAVDEQLDKVARH